MKKLNVLEVAKNKQIKTYNQLLVECNIAKVDIEENYELKNELKQAKKILMAKLEKEALEGKYNPSVFKIIYEAIERVDIYGEPIAKESRIDKKILKPKDNIDFKGKNESGISLWDDRKN